MIVLIVAVRWKFRTLYDIETRALCDAIPEKCTLKQNGAVDELQKKTGKKRGTENMKTFDLKLKSVKLKN